MTEQTPVPQEVQDKMNEGVRQRYAVGTQGLDKPEKVQK